MNIKRQVNVDETSNESVRSIKINTPWKAKKKISPSTNYYKDISLVTTAMNRTDFLKQTIPTWLYKNFREIIIVDWSSNTPIIQDMPEIALNEKVKIIRIDDKKHFHLSAARNIGARQATGKYLLFIDADIKITGDLVKSVVDRKFYRGRSGVTGKSTSGTCLIPRINFESVSGYNQQIVTWGYEDNDLYNRLERSGLRKNTFLKGSISHIDHSDELRIENRPQEGRTIDETREENADMSDKKRAIVVAVKWIFDQTCTLLTNLEENISVPYDLYVFHEGLTPEQQTVIKEVYNCKDIKEYDEFTESNTREFTSQTMARYECFNLLKYYNQVMWLDIDILIRKNIDEMFYEYTDGICAVTKELGFERNFTGWVIPDDIIPVDKIPMGEPFSNFGIMIVNDNLPNHQELAKWCTEKTYQLFEDDKLYFPDQAVLNFMIWNFDLPLTKMDIKYNYSWVLEDAGIKRIDDPVIYHFIGINKPWRDDLIEDANKKHGRKYVSDWRKIYKRRRNVLNENTKVWLLAAIGADIKLLPQFMKHYKKLGIDNYIIVLNAKSMEDPIIESTQIILDQYDTKIAKIWTEPFTENTKVEYERETILKMCDKQDWIIYADMDEFHEYPYDLKYMLAYCEKNGYTYMIGEVLDRIGAGGKLVDFNPDLPVEEQFPVGCHITRNFLNACTREVVAARTKHYVYHGHHGILDENSGWLMQKEHLLKQKPPFDIVVNHYKWDTSVIPRMKQVMDEYADDSPAGSAWFFETENAYNHMVKYDGINIDDPIFECIDPNDRRMMKRNLIYYIYPIQGAMLNFNIRQLIKYFTIFNNKKIVYASIDENTLSAQELQELFALHGLPDYSLRLIKNNPELGEGVSFYEMLAEVKSLNKDEATFFAHAKGVSPDVLKRRKCTMEELFVWLEQMYKLNLEDISLVNEVMRNYPCAGTFKDTNVINMDTKWYYAGTFFWFNHKELFSRPDWEDVGKGRYRVEEYLGKKFKASEGYCFGDYNNMGFMYESKTYERIDPIRRNFNPADISIVTTCMNRWEFLQKALGTWRYKGFKEIIIVDWSSDEPVYNNLRGFDPEWDHIRIVRVEGKDHFNAGVARNVGVSISTGKYLWFLDSDQMLIDLKSCEDLCLREGRFYHGTDNIPPFGTCIIARKNLDSVGGYTEYMPGYGWEDNDLYDRLMWSGVGRYYYPDSVVKHIDHDDDLRIKHRGQEGKTMRETLVKNRLLKRKWSKDCEHEKVDFEIIEIKNEPPVLSETDMDLQPKDVSVVVPLKDNEEFLKKAIPQWFNHNFKEILIVDWTSRTPIKEFLKKEFDGLEGLWFNQFGHGEYFNSGFSKSIPPIPQLDTVGNAKYRGTCIKMLRVEGQGELNIGAGFNVGSRACGGLDLLYVEAKEENIDLEAYLERTKQIDYHKGEKLQIESANEVSVVTTCMNRIEFLSQSLPTWLGRGFKEIVIVDWNSETPILDEIKAITKGCEETIKVVRVEGMDHFNAGLARNTGTRETTSEYVLYMDSDIKVINFMNVKLSPETFYHGLNKRSPFGTCFIPKKALEDVNGYTELMPGYGWEDNDLYIRVEEAGYNRVYLDRGCIEHIDHSDELRFKHRGQEGSTIIESLQKNTLQRVRGTEWSKDNEQQIVEYKVYTNKKHSHNEGI